MQESLPSELWLLTLSGCGNFQRLPLVIPPQGLTMLRRFRSPRLVSLFIAFALLTCLLLNSLAGLPLGVLAAESTASDSPRLAVLVVFDQLRGYYLSRWEKLFGERGFRRLQQEGAWFTNCHYPYSDTITAAGHASIATGCSPCDHGIIENDWYDRAAGKDVYSVVTGRYER